MHNFAPTKFYWQNTISVFSLYALGYSIFQFEISRTVILPKVALSNLDAIFSIVA